MRFLGKFLLFLGFLPFPYLLPATTQIDNCHWQAWGDDRQNFGTQGKNGKNGQPGNAGKSSDTITIFADGSPLTLSLSGQNGTDGETGQNGTEGNCANQPQQVSRNLQAANGGNGGSGGDGGNGGDGGILTIYTTYSENLKQITVNAAGGQGGQPGQGGLGGLGCKCSEPYWTIQSCTGKPGSTNYNCTTREFRCQDGLNGSQGNSGRAGREGRLGQLTLINLDRPLVADQPTASVPMSELKERGYTLSKNQWETRQGAMSLFAPGSLIDDQYRILTKRVEHSFLLIWNAPQTFDKFANQRLTLSLGEQEDIQVTLPKDVWIEGTTQQRGTLTEFIVYNAVLEKEVTKLKSQGISGNGTNLQVSLSDQAGQSNLIATQFQVKYRVSRSSDDIQFRPASDFYTRYEGEIPPDLIVQDGDQFILAIGQLPIPPEYLKSGTAIEVEIKASRVFAGYSKEQKIVIRDVIKGLK